MPNLSTCKSILYELISENSFSEAVFFVCRQIYPHLCIVDQQNEIKNHVELKNESVTTFKISFDNFNKIVNDLDYETNKLNNFNYTLFKMLQLKLETINESLQDIFIELNLKFTYNAGS